MSHRTLAFQTTCAIALIVQQMLTHPAIAQPVVTYHNDIQRTGWNPHETTLTPASVAGGRFTLQHSVVLDEQVDTQPLVMKGQVIAGQKIATVVYVATANDTVYAIDGNTGAILLSRHLGAPVAQSALPGQCSNNAPSIGVDSTPAISVAAQAMYLVADTYENGAPVMRLHAIGLGTLQDIAPPVVIAASHKLTDGSTFNLDPSASRQRSALLLSGGNVFAGFASYCDMRADHTRGWLLGWNAASLAPLPNSELTNQNSQSPDTYFLSTIWMSGFGPATAKQGDSIYVITGNSDYDGATYNGLTNLSESLLKISPNLSRVQSHFTPANQARLDQQDTDFGSGGALVLPPQSGLDPALLAAAGKDGNLFLLDQNNEGGPPLGAYPIGPCWCGPSYFAGSDGVGRVVTSGGSNVEVWRVQTSPTSPASLAQEHSTPIATGQDGGFFTSVSSNGSAAGSAVVWAVSRPMDSNPANVTLYAIDPTRGSVIYSATAGTWPNSGANANIVPTVASGHVYVASNRELAIFGLGKPPAAAEHSAMLAQRQATLQANAAILQLAADEHQVSGRIVGQEQSVLTIQTRDGVLLHADTSAARRGHSLGVPVTGRAVLVVGTYAEDGVMTVHYMQRVKSAPALWPANR